MLSDLLGESGRGQILKYNLNRCNKDTSGFTTFFGSSSFSL